MNEQPRNARHWRLMVSGVLAANTPREVCVVIERGMPILSRNGEELGKVAAVSIDEHEAVNAILLSRLPRKMEYRIVPAELVTGVRRRAVGLTIDEEGIDALEKRASP